MSVTITNWLTDGVFVAACMWAKPKTEFRCWVLIFAGVLLWLVGYSNGRLDERERTERETPTLTDRNMPR